MAPKVSRPLETATVTRRRLRLKTPEGAIHVVDVPSPSLIGAAMDTATRSVTWCETFLQVEELEQEDAQKRKAVYLITLPHPRAAGRDDLQTLRAPEDFKGNSKAIANIIRDVFDGLPDVEIGRVLLECQDYRWAGKAQRIFYLRTPKGG